VANEPKDPSTQPAGRERRRFTRVALDAHVQVSVVDADALFDSRVSDLSENGVFILTRSTRPIGTGIKLAIVVRDGELEVRASGIIVREVKPDQATAEQPAGIGVMFTDVDDETSEHLDRLIQTGEPLS
jgi:uncharacterized protein (TIGR02266 family)